MKYLINLTSDVYNSLEDGNFRGEPRWERNVVAALLQNNKEVHLTREAWKAEKKPDNLYNGTNSQWLDDSVLITHGIGTQLHVTSIAAKYIIQFHEDPIDSVRNQFLSYGKNIIATTDSKNPFTYERLTKSLGQENLFHVPGPMVPKVYLEADNFKKPNLTWIYRNFTSFIQEKSNDMKKLLEYLDTIIGQDPSVRIKIIIGLWDTWGPLGGNPSSDQLKEWAFTFDSFKFFIHLKNKFDFYCNLDWSQVMSILQDTRYCISPAEPLGCPAFEAAMFGIPTVVNKDVNPFMTQKNGVFFPEVLKSNRAIDNQFLDLLDKLQNDHSFYLKHGNAYRTWVKDNATYSAYVKQLEDIMTIKGWL
jgi:hypothetical protein